MIEQFFMLFALLIENFKIIFEEEVKKETDERINFEKHMLYQQKTSLKQVPLQIQNDMEQLKHYDRCLSLITDDILLRKKENRI